MFMSDIIPYREREIKYKLRLLDLQQKIIYTLSLVLFIKCSLFLSRGFLVDVLIVDVLTSRASHNCARISHSPPSPISRFIPRWLTKNHLSAPSLLSYHTPQCPEVCTGHKVRQGKARKGNGKQYHALHSHPRFKAACVQDT